jgi:hypothetical protein
VTSSTALRRFAFAFGASFAVLYVIIISRDLALFTVFPSLGIVLLGTHHTKDIADPAMGFLAPAMYWYGWAASAALGALVLGLVTTMLSVRWSQMLGLSVWVWLVPALSMIACVYLTLPWFRL